MEQLVSRFPHIAEQIFEELDNYHFIQCKVISPTWKNFMEENKFSYIKYIKTLTNCSKKAIKTIFPQANLEDTIRLALDVSKVYDELRKEFVTEPSLTLFHLAANNGHLSICQLMIDGIKDRHPRDINGSYPLHLAAENGNFSICQLIMGKNDSKFPQVDCPQNFDKVFGIDFQHNTPIHMAAQNGHLNICRFITERITLNHKYVYKNYQENINGNTPLHLAAESGHLDVCQYLINQVQDENTKNYNGETPFQLAKKNRRSKVCRMIIDWNSLAKTNNWVQTNTNQLFVAIKGGCLDDYKQILQNESEKNPTMDKYGYTVG